jgi:hypothetical protein
MSKKIPSKKNNRNVIETRGKNVPKVASASRGPCTRRSSVKPGVPERIARKPFVDNYDLPAGYDASSLTLIARDPYCIFAYWEISPTSIEAVKNVAGSQFDRATYVIRMYDVTLIDFNGKNANHWFDIDVGPHARNWYIYLWCGNVSYCADLGIRMPGGRFFPLVRSNSVSTPRASPSRRSEQIWMNTKSNSTQAPFVVGEIHKVVEKPPLSQQKPPPMKKEAAEPVKARKSRKIFLTEDDIREYYSKHYVSLQQTISTRLSGQYGGTGSGNQHVSVHIKDGKTEPEDYASSGLSKGHFLRRLLAGSSAELVSSGASESILGGGSGQGAPEGKGKNFFFEIGTDLIVYGRTEPDAEVWLEGKKIALQHDGTFSLRFALQEGKIPLDFVACSGDKVDKREILTAVERAKTRYYS